MAYLNLKRIISTCRYCNTLMSKYYTYSSQLLHWSSFKRVFIYSSIDMFTLHCHSKHCLYTLVDQYVHVYFDCHSKEWYLNPFILILIDIPKSVYIDRYITNFTSILIVIQKSVYMHWSINIFTSILIVIPKSVYIHWYLNIFKCALIAIQKSVYMHWFITTVTCTLMAIQKSVYMHRSINILTSKCQSEIFCLQSIYYSLYVLLKVLYIQILHNHGSKSLACVINM